MPARTATPSPHGSAFLLRMSMTWRSATGRNGSRGSQGSPPRNWMRPPQSAVFEYMISNLDGAMTAGPAGEDCCHNSRLMGPEGATGASTGLIPVPYDFDETGLVNVPYAAPPDGIHVANVKVRRYRGFCAHNEEAKAFLTQISTRHDSLMAILDETPELTDRTRRNAANYLGDFFEEAGSSSKVADLMKVCLH